MKEHSFSGIREGLRESFRTRIDPGHIAEYARLSGDGNPLHTDERYARARGFPACVAHGMLTASLYSRLVGMQLPGRRALLHRVDASFLKPVFGGDELEVVGEVSAVNETARQIEIRAEILRDGEKVSRARIWVGFHE